MRQDRLKREMTRLTLVENRRFRKTLARMTNLIVSIIRLASTSDIWATAMCNLRCVTAPEIRKAHEQIATPVVLRELTGTVRKMGWRKRLGFLKKKRSTLPTRKTAREFSGGKSVLFCFLRGRRSLFVKRASGFEASFLFSSSILSPIGI